MKIDELVDHSRRDAERSRELERRAAAGLPPADEEEAFVRGLLGAGANDAIVRAVAAMKGPAASAPSAHEPAAIAPSASAPAPIARSGRWHVFTTVAVVAAPVALAAGLLFFIGGGAKKEALPAYAISAGGIDAPVRGVVAANGGELSEGALVTVTAEPEHAVGALVAARAYARCDRSAWIATGGRLTVASSGAVRFQAAREDAFGTMRGVCELAIVVALKGEPLLAPGAGATNVLTARFFVR